MKGFNLIFFSISLTTACYLQAISYQTEFGNHPGPLITKEYNVDSQKPLKNRSLLIVGCARSGTSFITNFLRLNKYYVGHEREGLFGIVSWTMTANANTTPWGPGFNHFSFKHIFHQVRHPLKAIASAGNEPPISWIFIKKFVPEIKMDDPKIVKGAKYWYYWNLLAEKKAEWSYRIEDIENQIDEMAVRLGVHLNPAILKKIPTNINTRGYTDVYTWEDLRTTLDEDLYCNIIEMATRYGYDLSEL